MKRPEEVAPAVRSTVLIALLGMAALAAQAQKVYRCGTHYSEMPCPGGLEIKVDDARTPEQQAQAQQAHEREAALARTLETERLDREQQELRERQAAQQAAARADHPKKRREEKKQQHMQRPRKQQDEVYLVPGTLPRRQPPAQPAP